MREDGGKQAELQHNRTSQHGQATAGRQHDNQTATRLGNKRASTRKLTKLPFFSTRLSYVWPIATGSGPPSVVGEIGEGCAAPPHPKDLLEDSSSRGGAWTGSGCCLLVAGRMLGGRTREGDARRYTTQRGPPCPLQSADDGVKEGRRGEGGGKGNPPTARCNQQTRGWGSREREEEGSWCG